MSSNMSTDAVPGTFDNDEDFALFEFAESLQEDLAEPWFMEMTRLRRIHFLYLNKRLAAWKKKVQEDRKASDADVDTIGRLLSEQGKLHVWTKQQSLL